MADALGVGTPVIDSLISTRAPEEASTMAVPPVACARAGITSSERLSETFIGSGR